jgi:hypothetical protein
MKLIKKISLALVGAIVVLLAYMNLTPGHFQYSCTCNAEYITNEMVEARKISVCRLAGACAPNNINNTIGNILIFLSKLDLYK